MRLLFIADPPAALNPKKDSTVALMRAAARRGDEIWHAAISDLSVDQNGVVITSRRFAVSEDDDAWMTTTDSARLRDGDIDLTWMRKEPPVDDRFVMATRFLDMLSIPVINAPRALREWNEKLSVLRFPDLIPPTWVGSRAADAVAFHRRHGAVALKPLDGMGGQGVYIAPADDLNFRSVFGLLSDNGETPVMAQSYLPAAREEDSRVFVVAGKPLERMLTRIPRADDHRGNLAAGGRAEARPLGATERAIAEAVGGELAKNGILFAGLDVIGGRLIEINITCPTGLRETRDQTGDDPAEKTLAACCPR